MDLEQVASVSLINCHAPGLDSIVFNNTPGRRVRMFVAGATHNLWKNAVPLKEDMSVAFHPHHCKIALQPHRGEVYNVIEAGHRGKVTVLDEFEYSSQILTGKGGFVRTGENKVLRVKPMRLRSTWPMDADMIHTIYVPKGQCAAWYVYEYAEDPKYKPVCWANHNLELVDFSELYQPMDVKYLEGQLLALGVIQKARTA
jgi:hypothetical protein